MNTRIFLFTLFLCLTTSSGSLLAQHNPAEADTTFALGTFNGDVRAIKVLQDGKILVGGDFTYYKTTPANRLARLNPDGTLDPTFAAGMGANNSIRTLAIQSDGKILVGGDFTSFNGVSMNYIARLNADGTVDNSFTFGSGANYYVYSIAIQSDGKILAGGGFTSFNGVSANRIVRLNANGLVDNSFNIGTAANSWVYSIAIQSDGKILAGGGLSSFNGISANRIVRLNEDGTVDNSFTIGTGASDWVHSIGIQSDGKILAGGRFTSFNGALANHIVRLNADGTVDNSFNIGTGASSLVSTISAQPDGKILAGGEFSSFNGISLKCIVRLNADGSVDNSFIIGSGASRGVYGIAIQSDGKILAGGGFTSFNGVLANCFVRLDPDGSVESNFAIGAGPNNYVESVAIQSDGKILAGGYFTSFNSVSANRIVRLNADGSVDNNFTIGTGANSWVESIAIQSDGKILAGGQFTSFNGVLANHIVRLNADGSVDNSFTVGTGASGSVNAIAIQSDGKILAAGGFMSFNGVSANRIVRLNADGTVDNSFTIGTGANNQILSIAIQSDGKILAGGWFTSFNGISRNYIIRLNADGSVDSSFNIGTGASSWVYSIAIQTDGKILAGGLFTNFNGVSRNRIVRLNADGSVDNSFNIGTGASSAVYSIAIQQDGKILAGGSFNTFNGVTRNYIVRLNADGSVDNSFNIGTGASTWVKAIAIQSDGRILAGGEFTTYNNVAYNFIVRLKGDPIYFNTIRGNIYTDANKDCNYQISENAVPYVVVKALPGPYYGGSDAYGKYQVRVDSGAVNYHLTQEFNSINSKLLINQCAPSHTVALTGASKDTCCFNFADSIRQCALLNISVQNSRMRRCFKGNTFVNYSNYGTGSSSGTQIKVIYPSHVVPISSTPMWTSKQDSILTYDIGTLAANASGRITIIDSVKCGDESIRGRTQCIKATISPVSNCVAQNPSWDKSSIKVTGKCQSELVVFTITNGGSGDMSGTHEYRIYVNNILIYTNVFQLKAGESFTVSYPAQGQTIRLEADQHTLHPGRSRPRATIEGCGNSGQEEGEPLLTAPLDDLNEEEAITCNTIIDSYDPNDKQALPKGIGSDRKISPGEEIEYTIRFQNTGTDTAYTVKIVDTLDVNLDVASFTQGTSSHPYKLDISGKGKAVLTFNFYNINLPDSTTNNEKSNGLVSFRIKVPESTPLGTVIKNQAHIFFDYNSAIITNETMHTVDNTIETDFARGSEVQVGNVITGTNNYSYTSVKVYPNPTEGNLTIELPESGYSRELRVFSIIGVLEKTIKLNGSTMQQVNLGDLNEGMYLYEIREEGQRKAGGLVEIR
ncbi:MAG TPA: T9SS type A sorting domain-containing protein [Cytophagaceae bacterium]